MHDNFFWRIFHGSRGAFKHSDLPGATGDNKNLDFNIFHQTRPLYLRPPLSPPAPPPPPILEWPRKIYVATNSMGVYYTENFSGPTGQPTWTRVNDGLATLNCYEFHLDPFDPEGRQFVVTNTGAVLYMRTNQGAWVNIFDANDRGDLTGNYSVTKLGGFCLDPTIEGRIWMACTDGGCEYSFVSDDFGATWSYGTIYCGPYTLTGTIRAHGDWAWSSDSAGVGVYGYMLWTSNKGATWRWQVIDITGQPEIEYNPLSETYVYFGTPQFGIDLGRFASSSSWAYLDYSVCFDQAGGMWFDETVKNHQRLIHINNMYFTDDEWATKTTPGVITPWPTGIIAPWCGSDTDQIMLGTIGDHVVSTLYGESDISATGIAGNYPTIAPYVDSIPKYSVSGGVCHCGIQPVKEDGYTYI